jgi:hypothetical protein
MPRYFDVEVTLVLPRRVWRRFLIAKSATFGDLRAAIQDALGWQNCHLFEFRHPGHEMTVIQPATSRRCESDSPTGSPMISICSPRPMNSMAL